MAPRRVLLLDVDGVLVRGDFSDVLRERHGITPEQTRAFFTGPFQQCSLGKGDLLECLAPHLPEWGWDSSLEDLIDLWFGAATVVEEDVLAAVRRYRAAGIECWLATVQEQRRMDHLLTARGLAQEFDGWFYSAEIGAFKTEPAYWAHVGARLGLPPDALLLVDDDQRNVDAARASGLRAELYRELPDLHAAVSKHFGAL